jgi:hypothetical protein
MTTSPQLAIRDFRGAEFLITLIDRHAKNGTEKRAQLQARSLAQQHQSVGVPNI